jgi:hypothetical protein
MSRYPRILSAAALVLASVPGLARNADAATIGGQVTDAVTGAPIAQASITITGIADQFVIGPIADNRVQDSSAATIWSLCLRRARSTANRSSYGFGFRGNLP